MKVHFKFFKVSKNIFVVICKIEREKSNITFNILKVVIRLKVYQLEGDGTVVKKPNLLLHLGINIKLQWLIYQEEIDGEKNTQISMKIKIVWSA